MNFKNYKKILKEGQFHNFLPGFVQCKGLVLSVCYTDRFSVLPVNTGFCWRPYGGRCLQLTSLYLLDPINIHMMAAGWTKLKVKVKPFKLIFSLESETACSVFYFSLHLSSRISVFITLTEKICLHVTDSNILLQFNIPALQMNSDYECAAAVRLQWTAGHFTDCLSVSMSEMSVPTLTFCSFPVYKFPRLWEDKQIVINVIYAFSP